MQKIEILFSDSRGIYIPKLFAELYRSNDSWQGVTEEQLQDIDNPDNEFYWDTWDTVLSNAYYIDKETNKKIYIASEKKRTKKYTLHQDGDLFAICRDDLTEEETNNLFGEY